MLAGVLLFFVGAGFTAWSANSNAIMQLAAPDHLRGRVIGLYFYAFNGTGAIAGIMTGWLCAVGGTELAFVVSGLIGLVAVGATALMLGWTPRLTTAPPRRAAAARLIRSPRHGEDRPSTADEGGDQVSVIMTLRVSGDPDKLEQMAAEHADMIRGISERAQAARRDRASLLRRATARSWSSTSGRMPQSFQHVLRSGAGDDRPADGAGRDERAGDHLLAEARDRRRRRLGVAG